MIGHGVATGITVSQERALASCRGILSVSCNSRSVPGAFAYRSAELVPLGISIPKAFATAIRLMPLVKMTAPSGICQRSRPFGVGAAKKKSRRGRTPWGIRPRRPTRQRAPRPSRVALHLVVRPVGFKSSSEPTAIADRLPYISHCPAQVGNRKQILLGLLVIL
jgi:hypothetical protein